MTGKEANYFLFVDVTVLQMSTTPVLISTILQYPWPCRHLCSSYLILLCYKKFRGELRCLDTLSRFSFGFDKVTRDITFVTSCFGFIHINTFLKRAQGPFPEVRQNTIRQSYFPKVYPFHLKQKIKKTKKQKNKNKKKTNKTKTLLTRSRILQ